MGRHTKPQTIAGTTAPIATVAHHERPFELDTVAWSWQRALDAAQDALNAEAAGWPGLPASELNRRRRGLAEEKRHTAHMLQQLAVTTAVRPVPWLSAVPVNRNMVGLPATVDACLFDLDGVLTDSGALHSDAWAHVFDDFLLRRSEETGWHFKPFAREADYDAFIGGRPRLEGVHSFLASRGIRLAEGLPNDPPDAETAHGLANHKRDLLAVGLRRRGATARPTARRYLQAARYAGLKLAVLSASTSTWTMLDQATLATLIDVRIDADTIRREHLRSRPAPDLLIAACEHLGVLPAQAVTFTQNPAGVAAGHAAGIPVIGVAEGTEADILSGFGAERVIPTLGALLDRQILDSR
jgi:HAD superfamily hydrolase (TIGR01509 family)